MLLLGLIDTEQNRYGTKCDLRRWRGYFSAAIHLLIACSGEIAATLVKSGATIPVRDATRRDIFDTVPSASGNNRKNNERMDHFLASRNNPLEDPSIRLLNIIAAKLLLIKHMLYKEVKAETS